MPTFAIQIGEELIAVRAADWRFDVADAYEVGAYADRKLHLSPTFTDFGGLVVDPYCAAAGVSAPTPGAMAPEFWLPADHIRGVHRIDDGATAAGVGIAGTKNVYLVIPWSVVEGAPKAFGAVSADRWPLFVADGFQWVADSASSGNERTRARTPGATETLLSFSNFRGRVRWGHLTSPGALPATRDFDGYFPRARVAAVFRIHTNLWP